MAATEKQLDAIKDELKWIHLREIKTQSSKGVYGFLIPLGLAVTTGILGTGLYHFIKRDQRKQQICMRYRVLAQGVTVALLMAAVFQSKASFEKNDQN